jgi:hypothetical protein
MSKKSPEEILKQLEKPASSWGRPASDPESPGDDDMDAVLAMTDAEVRAELEADGVDLKALDAKAAAIAAKTEAAPGKSGTPAPTAEPPATSTQKLGTVVPLRPRTARWMKWGPIAIAAGTGGVIGLSQLIEMGQPSVLVASGQDAGPESERRREARALRADARAACEDQKWARCLSLLDRAATLEPEGDTTPEARRLRRLAEEGASDAGAKE